MPDTERYRQLEPPGAETRSKHQMDRYRQIIPDFERFQKTIDRPLGRTARVNRLKSTREEAVEAAKSAGIMLEPLDWNDDAFYVDEGNRKLGNSLPYYLGHLHIQEEVSMLPTLVLDPEMDDDVLDLCAAPGNKTTQLSELASEGTVTANDDDIGRIAALRNNTDRLGTTNVAVTNVDGRRFPGRERFDSVLVDAPCSSEGTCRKNPDMRDGATLETVEAVQGVQKGLLKRGLGLLKPGGELVYSTCTFAPEENEEVVDHVLDGVDGNYELLDPELPIGSVNGVTEWRDRCYSKELEKTSRIYPHLNDTGGFYVARIKKW
ncbi:MAG: NOL1/NOP2/sun family putative RNA methylase [Halobacteria archaeon]